MCDCATWYRKWKLQCKDDDNDGIQYHTLVNLDPPPPMTCHSGACSLDILWFGPQRDR